MKKTLYIILLFTALGTNGQSFVTNNKLWSTMEGPIFGCKPFYCKSYFTKFSGDTLIEGIHYTKVLHSEDQQMLKWITEGFIREDSNQKVFYKHTIAKQECLLYDFGCNPGDTLYLNCGCRETGYLVDSIRTIATDGISRKYFYLTYLQYGNPEIWIEGIGCTLGILNAGAWDHCSTGGGKTLLCFFEDGTKKYQSPEVPNHCFLSPEIIDGIATEKTVSQFKVYPNPVSVELFIQPTSNFEESYTLEIYSVKGERVRTECLEQGNYLHRIDTGSLQNGIYILRLISPSGKYDEKLIVKE